MLVGIGDYASKSICGNRQHHVLLLAPETLALHAAPDGDAEKETRRVAKYCEASPVILYRRPEGEHRGVFCGEVAVAGVNRFDTVEESRRKRENQSIGASL